MYDVSSEATKFIDDFVVPHGGCGREGTREPSFMCSLGVCCPPVDQSDLNQGRVLLLLIQHVQICKDRSPLPKGTAYQRGQTPREKPSSQRGRGGPEGEQEGQNSHHPAELNSLQ